MSTHKIDSYPDAVAKLTRVSAVLSEILGDGPRVTLVESVPELVVSFAGDRFVFTADPTGDRTDLRHFAGAARVIDAECISNNSARLFYAAQAVANLRKNSRS